MTTNPLTLILAATKEVWQFSGRLRVWFAVVTVVLFSAYILLPVWLTVGNTVAFQLSLLRLKDYALFASLSLVTALLVVMQLYIVQRSRERKRMAVAVGSGGVGIYSALLSGLMATAACLSCVAALLGFLGAGTVLFIIVNRWYFIAGAIAVVMISLYFSARRVLGVCEDCEVPKHDKGK